MKIVLTPGSQQFLDVTQRWSERLRDVARVGVYLAAQYSLRGIRQMIPAGRAYRKYRQSLRLVEVRSKAEYPVFAIVGVPRRAAAVSSLRAKQYLIHVRAKRKLSPVNPAVAILIENNPWTEDTLPFKPLSTQAILEYENVSAVRRRTVSKQRDSDRDKWELALRRAGLRLEQMPQSPKTRESGLVQEALQLEFGRGAAPAVPHWRPTLRGIDRKGILHIINRSLAGRKYLDRVFTATKAPKFKMPKLTVISPEQMRRGIEFSKRILKG